VLGGNCVGLVRSVLAFVALRGLWAFSTLRWYRSGRSS